MPLTVCYLALGVMLPLLNDPREAFSLVDSSNSNRCQNLRLSLVKFVCFCICLSDPSMVFIPSIHTVSS